MKSMKMNFILSVFLLILVFPDTIVSSRKPQRKSNNKLIGSKLKSKSRNRNRLEEDYKGFPTYTMADHEKLEKLLETAGEFSSIENQIKRTSLLLSVYERITELNNLNVVFDLFFIV